jgi:alpha-L-rhamnosidase
MILSLNLTKMKLFALLGILLPFGLLSQVSIQTISVENQQNPIGIGVSNPRFSWKMSSSNRNETQSAYSIQVSQGKKQIWNSGKVASSASLFIPYGGEKLQSNAKYQIKVQVWNTEGKASKPVESAFYTALLAKEDWKAKWISSGLPADSVNGRVPFFANQFVIKKQVSSVRAFVTAKGVYEAQINGSRVGDSYLNPGWTSYNKHLQYQVYDLTKQIKQGTNIIHVQVGSGWFRSRLGWQNNQNYYGSQTALLWQLEISYQDGSKETVISDKNWQVGYTSIVSSEIYDGEHIDTRINSGSSGNAIEVQGNFEVLDAQINEPVKKQDILPVKRVLTSPKGYKILDFGQNIVGWVKLNVKGKSGQKVVLRHVEMLDKNNEPYFENLRSAKALATYELNGEQQEIEPHFTFFGFRYVQVEGLDVHPEDFQAIALHSDMTSTGSFETSNPLLNQLQSNIRWGQKGNFLDVPTDCPQRDERLGWTGDAEVFSRTASFNFNVNQFFAKWLKDVKADQFPNGAVPHVIPDILNKPNAGPEAQNGAAGWSDASIIIPYNVYTTFGDKQVLENQYASM